MARFPMLRRPQRWLAGGAVALCVTGCSAWPALLPNQQDETTVLPTEDGNRYVAVTSGRRGSAATVRGKWKRAAHHACSGDYLVLTEDATERRTAGLVSGRGHEGYVRCVNPEPDPPAAKRSAARRR